jgi:hypothetical protein
MGVVLGQAVYRERAENRGHTEELVSA